MKPTPYPFTLRQLQYALAVAETRSFRRAAERCHVSQPALSAQLAQLEGALGVTLFERDRRRVLVTAAGAAGFGTAVLKRMTESALSGDVRIDYAPEGVVWHVRCPLAALHDGPGKDTSI